MKTMQATELRKNLFETLRKLSVNREPVQILRWGKPVAVLSVVTTQGELDRPQINQKKD